MKRLSTIFFVAILILTMAPGAVYALNTGPASLTVIIRYEDELLEGINVAVCRVADAEEKRGCVTYNAVPEFSGAEADFTNLTKEKNIALSARLNVYSNTKGIARSVKATNRGGKAVYTNLSPGLYLVAQENDENSDYVIAPYLVAGPYQNSVEEEWEYDVIAYPKADLVKLDVEEVSVSVFKVWKGTDNPPGRILVQLYSNGNPYGSVVILNGGNYWSHTWDGLDPSGKWTADEISVPDGYTKTVSGSAAAGFIITNTKNPATPGNPGNQGNPGDGPKTGDTANIQLWITLIIVASGGLLTVIFGRRIRER